MKKAVRRASTVLILAHALAAVAQPTESIAIFTEQGLSFGQVIATAAAGSVLVTPEGMRSGSGGAFLGSGLDASPSLFNVTGEPNQVYTISLPSSVIVSNGAQSMTVSGFESNPSGSGNLGSTGSETLAVGATLEVGSSQSGGTYSGTFMVTVAYN